MQTAILVFACDRYELLYKGFDVFFKKNWDHSKPIKIYFATENKDIELDGYSNIKSGDGEWTNRLKRILNQIEEEYIIFIQEDMWLNKKVHSGIIDEILTYTIKNDLKLVKLHSSPVYNTNELEINFSGFLLSKLIKEKSDFLMSHQISVWNKNFLHSQLKDDEHPWRNERRGSKRLKKDKEDIYQIDFISENGNSPNNKNHFQNSSGEYHTISANACLDPKAKWFIEELKTDYPDYAKKLMHHLENNITHDGKPKPRKVDVFKKVKNKILSLTKNRRN